MVSQVWIEGVLNLIISKVSNWITFAAKTIVFVDSLTWLTVTVQIAIFFSSRIFKRTAICLTNASIWTIKNWFFNWWVTSNLAHTWDISWDKHKSIRANCKKLVSSELGYLYYCKHSHVVMRSWGLQHFSTSLSCLESHAGFFILSMKGRFDVYLLRSVGEKLIFIL